MGTFTLLPRHSSQQKAEWAYKTAQFLWKKLEMGILWCFIYSRKVMVLLISNTPELELLFLEEQSCWLYARLFMVIKRFRLCLVWTVIIMFDWFLSEFPSFSFNLVIPVFADKHNLGFGQNYLFPSLSLSKKNSLFAITKILFIIHWSMKCIDN